MFNIVSSILQCGDAQYKFEKLYKEVSKKFLKYNLCNYIEDCLGLRHVNADLRCVTAVFCAK